MKNNRWVHIVNRSGRVVGTGRVIRVGFDGVDVEGICTSWPQYGLRDVEAGEAKALQAQFEARTAKREWIEGNKVYRTHA